MQKRVQPIKMKPDHYWSEKSKSQLVLPFALFLIAIGNITIPNSISVISTYYLPAALLLVCFGLLHNFRFFIQQLRYPLVIVGTFVSFLPGFLISPLNDYGISKLAGVAISLLLVLSPFAFNQIDKNIFFITKCILTISIVTSGLLLLFGETSSSGRLTLAGLNPIGTARTVGLAAVILTFFAITGRASKLYSIFFIFPGILVSITATIATGSRGPLLSVLAGVIVIILFAWKVVGTKAYFSSLLLVGSLFLVFYFLAPIEEDSRIRSTESSGRDGLFSLSIETIKSNPIGVGWGNFGSLLTGNSALDGGRVYVHNIFLEIGVEAGWIALAGFVLLVFASSVNLLRSVWGGSETALLVLSLLVFCVINASLSSDFVGNRLMWLVLGLSFLQFSTYKAN